ASALAGFRADLQKLATSARSPVTRELGYVALIAADGNVDRAWQLGSKSPAALKDLVNAMPLVRDPGQRASLYPKVEPLLKGLPPELALRAGPAKTVNGRYVRVDLPGKNRTLTLAEVEVYSDGRNVARSGKAAQKNTAHGGEAGKAIDGNTSGHWGDGGQTHTQEDTSNPWWEVDLGSELPIDAIVIYNRTEGSLGRRLNGFTLQVLDESRRPIFQKTKLPAPDRMASYEVSGASLERAIRHAAMKALTSVRGQESETFKALARFVHEDADRHAAVLALQRIPVNYWPREEAKPVLDSILTYGRKVPAKERTSPAVLDALQLADALVGLLLLEIGRAHV